MYNQPSENTALGTCFTISKYHILQAGAIVKGEKMDLEDGETEETPWVIATTTLNSRNIIDLMLKLYFY